MIYLYETTDKKHILSGRGPKLVVKEQWSLVEQFSSPKTATAVCMRRYPDYSIDKNLDGAEAPESSYKKPPKSNNGGKRGRPKGYRESIVTRLLRSKTKFGKRPTTDNWGKAKSRLKYSESMRRYYSHGKAYMVRKPDGTFSRILLDDSQDLNSLPPGWTHVHPRKGWRKKKPEQTEDRPE